ncbi:hypothetical protein BG006_003117 [Podila minutissima]|uniref:Nibrin second BRCT domain-containing protein n=1 Tax=Podila minutissima TaxID=64525 RepID=A0A9P5VNE2_9FUNG|nr:hypothetical protein BG006_003117 [Podila minutissima]
MDTVTTRGQHTKVTVRDLNSKFGVKINGKQIEQAKDIEVVIEDSQTWVYHDKPHLAGRGYGGYADFIIGENTTFRLERVDISVCSSGMLQQEKLRLIESAVELDINIELKAWIPGTSTHLVIGNNKLTEKTFQALVQGAYLVNSSWLEALEKSLKESWEFKGTVFNPALETEFPIPPPQALQEACIDWQPNPARISLFEHHRFISLAEPKIKNLGQVVEGAGGRWSMEDPNSAMKVISECLSSTVMPVFLASPDADGREQLPNVDSVLKKMSYRWVQEDEVGRAVLLVATDMFCNPKYMGELPSYETLSLMLGSMNQSQSLYVGSLIVPSIVDSSTLEMHHTTQRAKAPHVIVDDDDSMGLSQFMPRSKKNTRTGPSTFAAAAETAPSSPKVENVCRPAKKKTKVDRMAAFFDLDDEDDDSMVISPPPKPVSVPTSTTVAPARSASNIDVPVAVAWPEPIDLISDHEDEVPKRETKESMETIPFKAPESTEQINLVSDHEDDTASQLLKEAVSTKKKKTAYESVREDMIALNLDRKVGRQKENLDEVERGKRLEAQREEARNKSLTTGLMQSERSDTLLAKHKRRKLIESPESSQGGNSVVEPCEIKPEASASLHILDDIKREDWPERWKVLPNFKTRPVITPALQEKWKNVPNYKTFRKSVLPGIQKAPGQPKPLVLDGEIVIKQEETMKKIETYIKREERPSSTSKARPKLSEKQMAKNDIKAMLSGGD